MSSIHLVFSDQGLKQCLYRADTDEPIVLLGAAVCHPDRDIYLVMEAECAAHGLQCSNGIDHPELVRLMVDHSPVVSWP